MAKDSTAEFEAICQAMSEPGFYPHPVSGLERRDTHISTVFLTGRRAYKLKKPVDFGFLNFRSLKARKRYCEREVELNQRLSRDIYLEVVPIYRRKDQRFSLTGPGRIVECAVKMRQLPEAVSLLQLLKQHKIRPRHMIRLGRRLAEFFDFSPRSSEIDGFGQPDVVAFNVEENFRQLAAFVGKALDPQKWEFICQVSRSFLNHRQNLFLERIQDGRVRDGHGDLRCDHVYFYRGLQIIDCIEFNDRFRYGDAALDLAFLHMDLEHHGHPEFSRQLIRAYASRAADPGVYVLLDFYAAYRAVVRLKIACFQHADKSRPEGPDEIQGYFGQAYRYALMFGRPTLWIFCGLPATGKSNRSAKVAAALAIPRLQSDQVRKDLFSPIDATVVPYGRGVYRPDLRRQVYAHMLLKAQEIIKQGESVILDATFSRRKWRDEARQLAVDHDATVIVVDCVSSVETIRRRLREREAREVLSDARVEHLEELMADFEPITEIATDACVKVDTEQPREETLAEILSEGYRCQSAQVARRIGLPDPRH
jgi:aminoglycoside phosphotransferase family enzyme/predicted kinase